MKLVKVKEPWNAVRRTVLPTEKLKDGTLVRAYFTDERGIVTQYERAERPDGKVEWYKLNGS